MPAILVDSQIHVSQELTVINDRKLPAIDGGPARPTRAVMFSIRHYSPYWPWAPTIHCPLSIVQLLAEAKGLVSNVQRFERNGAHPTQPTLQPKKPMISLQKSQIWVRWTFGIQLDREPNSRFSKAGFQTWKKANGTRLIGISEKTSYIGRGVLVFVGEWWRQTDPALFWSTQKQNAHPLFGALSFVWMRKDGIPLLYGSSRKMSGMQKMRIAIP